MRRVKKKCFPVNVSEGNLTCNSDVMANTIQLSDRNTAPKLFWLTTQTDTHFFLIVWVSSIAFILSHSPRSSVRLQKDECSLQSSICLTGRHWWPILIWPYCFYSTRNTVNPITCLTLWHAMPFVWQQFSHMLVILVRQMAVLLYKWQRY